MASSIGIQQFNVGIGQGGAQIFDTPESSKLLDYMRRERYAQNREEALAKRQKQNDLRDQMFKLLEQSKPGDHWASHPIHASNIENLRNEVIDEVSRSLQGDEIQASSYPNIYRKIGEMSAAVKKSNMELKQMEDAVKLWQSDPDLFSDEHTNIIMEVMQGNKTVAEAEKEVPNFYWRDKRDLFEAEQEFYDEYGAGLIEQTIETTPVAPGAVKVAMKKAVDEYLSGMKQYILTQKPGLKKDIETQMMKSFGVTDDAVSYWLENVVRPLREEAVKETYERSASPRSPINTDDDELITTASDVKRSYAESIATNDPSLLSQGALAETDIVVEPRGDGKWSFSVQTVGQSGKITRKNVKAFDPKNADGIFKYIAENSNVTYDDILKEPDWEAQYDVGDLYKQFGDLMTDADGFQDWVDSRFSGVTVTGTDDDVVTEVTIDGTIYDLTEKQQTRAAMNHLRRKIPVTSSPVSGSQSIDDIVSSLAPNEMARKTKDNRIAIFDATTKEFIRYAN